MKIQKEDSQTGILFFLEVSFYKLIRIIGLL